MILQGPSQEDKLADMFISNPGKWIPLPDILDMRISQYGRAIHSLRHKHKMKIENCPKYCKEDRSTHSWFRYIPKEKQMEFK